MRGRVLDIGAGAGRHSVEAQSRGLEVVAIDMSPGAVEVCRRRGIRDARTLALAEIGAELGLFDTVLLMCGNLGLAGSARATRETLDRLHALTTSHGKIVFDSVDPHVGNDEAERAYMERNARRGRMPGEVTIRIRYGEIATPWFELLCVSPAELDSLLPGTGWRLAWMRAAEPPDWYGVLEKA
ncbi:MAG TPA: class I SAM-dependent methyltransferase [Gaiellaceae bacterium]|nr:class I SAM-dependent methyltransferase [Gaiellaceae bacterium]